MRRALTRLRPRALQVGEDAAADEYHLRLVQAGVKPLLSRSNSGSRTAESVSVVSDDGQRTMRPYLGAAKVRARSRLVATVPSSSVRKS